MDEKNINEAFVILINIGKQIQSSALNGTLYSKMMHSQFSSIRPASLTA
jgi:hypothetical protein